MNATAAKLAATTAAGDERRSAAAAPVLVAIDLSPDSARALLWACDHAAAAGRPLAAVHVVHDPAESPGKYHPTGGRFIPHAEAAEQMLAAFLAALRRDNPQHAGLARIEPQLVEGLPAQRIVELAQQLDACMIIVGSRGQSGLRRLMNGSVAQKVVQLSPIPVTVVKEGP